MFDKFQITVSELLLRNKSILDLITKFQDSNSRVNREIIKAVTQCGCIEITGKKQNYSLDDDCIEMNNSKESHVKGELCNNCKELIEKEIGKNLFYLTSICNTMDINLYDVILKEHDRIKTLGKFNLR